METVTSADGSTIAYERRGTGPAVVVVGGALCDRAAHRPLAHELADRFTVVTYDRRGRGDSTDTPPYAVGREVEDLAALVAAAGGVAGLYGHSSGAAVALHAAAAGVPVARLCLHDAPFDDEQDRAASRAFAAETAALLAADRGDEAVRMFLSSAGMPPEAVDEISAGPGVRAMAPTLLHDFTALDADETALAGAIDVPTLVLVGAQSPPFMADAGRRLDAALPHGRLTVLPGYGHDVPEAALAPVLAEFFDG